MEFKNSESRYGVISKVFHWSIALLILVQFYLVYWKSWVLPEKSAIANFYINGLHKPIGVVVLLLAIFAVTWQVNNRKPSYPLNMPNWEKQSALFVQSVLYLTLFAMPISGLIMSTAAGYPPSFFGLFQFPQFIAKNKLIANVFFDIHAITGYIIIALVILHVAAALKHHFIDRDNILKRMLP
ncbi:MAG TPA: cytochrome b [Gammaproteobacteria bacterium]|nr:cytochrome b [Gammaproteobacteria bacterium]